MGVGRGQGGRRGGSVDRGGGGGGVRVEVEERERKGGVGKRLYGIKVLTVIITAITGIGEKE